MVEDLESVTEADIEKVMRELEKEDAYQNQESRIKRNYDDFPRQSIWKRIKDYLGELTGF